MSFLSKIRNNQTREKKVATFVASSHVATLLMVYWGSGLGALWGGGGAAYKQHSSCHLLEPTHTTTCPWQPIEAPSPHLLFYSLPGAGSAAGHTPVLYPNWLTTPHMTQTVQEL